MAAAAGRWWARPRKASLTLPHRPRMRPRSTSEPRPDCLSVGTAENPGHLPGFSAVPTDKQSGLGSEVDRGRIRGRCGKVNDAFRGRAHHRPAAAAISAHLQTAIDAVDRLRIDLADIHLMKIDRSLGAWCQPLPGLTAIVRPDEAEIAATRWMAAGEEHRWVRRMRRKAHIVVLVVRDPAHHAIAAECEKAVVRCQIKTRRILRIDGDAVDVRRLQETGQSHRRLRARPEHHGKYAGDGKDDRHQEAARCE